MDEPQTLSSAEKRRRTSLAADDIAGVASAGGDDSAPCIFRHKSSAARRLLGFVCCTCLACCKRLSCLNLISPPCAALQPHAWLKTLSFDPAEMDIIAAMLSAQFGDAHVDREQELILLQVTSAPYVVCSSWRPARFERVKHRFPLWAEDCHLACRLAPLPEEYLSAIMYSCCLRPATTADHHLCSCTGGWCGRRCRLPGRQGGVPRPGAAGARLHRCLSARMDWVISLDTQYSTHSETGCTFTFTRSNFQRLWCDWNFCSSDVLLWDETPVIWLLAASAYLNHTQVLSETPRLTVMAADCRGG